MRSAASGGPALSDAVALTTSAPARALGRPSPAIAVGRPLDAVAVVHHGAAAQAVALWRDGALVHLRRPALPALAPAV